MGRSGNDGRGAKCRNHGKSGGGRTRCDEAPKQTANGNYHAPTRVPRQRRLNPPAREGGVADNAASDIRCGNWMKKMTWVQCGLLFLKIEFF
jgi:hypothetical protein